MKKDAMYPYVQNVHKMNLNLMIHGFIIMRASEILINPGIFRSATISSTLGTYELLNANCMIFFVHILSYALAGAN